MATINNMPEANGSATELPGSDATASSAYDTTHHDVGTTVINKAMIPLVIIVALAVGGYVAYEVLVNNKSPDEIVPLLYGKGQEVIALFLDKGSKEAGAPPAGGQEIVAALPPPVIAAPAPAPLLAEPEMQIDAPLIDAPLIDNLPPVEANEYSNGQLQDSDSYMLDNPYLELPNHVPSTKLQFARAWSLQEEEVWRSGLTHQFAWQQHKTVQDVIDLRLAGSDTILWEALNNPRLWTRMQALIGLVKFGMNVDRNTVLRALGEERPSLVANYFKRFTVKNNAGERFVMRHALRTVGPRARLHIVKALVVGRDELSDLYLVAATLDKDRPVSRWAEAELKRQNMPLDTVEKYRGQVTSSSF